MPYEKVHHVLQIWQAYADLFPYLEIIFPLAHAGYEMVWAWLVPVLPWGGERTLGTRLHLNISPQSCVSGHVVRAVLGYVIEINWPWRPGYLSLRMGQSVRYRVRYWLFSSMLILWRHWVNWYGTWSGWPSTRLSHHTVNGAYCSVLSCWINGTETSQRLQFINENIVLLNNTRSTVHDCTLCLWW